MSVTAPTQTLPIGKEPPHVKAGMALDEWKAATKFDSTDWGWVIMSIGMAIGAGIVFLPVKVGVLGLWVFLASAVIGYPAMYLFQRLFINTLSSSPKCQDYAGVISGYLGNKWGALLGVLYFIMLVIWVFVYSTAINNDSASFLHSFGITEGLLSENPARSTAVAIYVGDWAVSQLWLFWVAPIVGGVLGAVIYKNLLGKESND